MSGVLHGCGRSGAQGEDEPTARKEVLVVLSGGKTRIFPLDLCHIFEHLLTKHRLYFFYVQCVLFFKAEMARYEL